MKSATGIDIESYDHQQIEKYEQNIIKFIAFSNKAELVLLTIKDSSSKYIM